MEKEIVKMDESRFPRGDNLLKVIKGMCDTDAEFTIIIGDFNEVESNYSGKILLNTGTNGKAIFHIDVTIPAKIIGTYEDLNRGTTRPKYGPDCEKKNIISVLEKVGVKRV